MVSTAASHGGRARTAGSWYGRRTTINPPASLSYHLKIARQDNIVIPATWCEPLFLLGVPVFWPALVIDRQLLAAQLALKAKENRRAIFYFGKSTSAEEYLQSSELGEKVSEGLFR